MLASLSIIYLNIYSQQLCEPNGQMGCVELVDNLILLTGDFQAPLVAAHKWDLRSE